MRFGYAAGVLAVILLLVGCPGSGDTPSGGGSSDAGAQPQTDAGSMKPAADGGGMGDAAVAPDSGAPVRDAGLHEVCRGHVCPAHASCREAAGEAVCACDSGYQDADDNGSCIEDCNASTCSGHGQCSTDSGSPLCKCEVGWSGDSCATPDCDGFDCSSHGSCGTSSGVAACNCRLGWTGADCATADCTGVTCSGQGVCELSSGVPLCLCNAGWSGAACSQPSCTDVSCNDHGSCETSGGVAHCVCATGWSGSQCTAPDCTGISCAHGSCSTSGGSAKCSCPAGWSGADCATADCAAINCSSHGSCDTGSGAAACSCALGWSGARCNIPDCSGITCAHGTCSTGSGTAACVCDANWTGSSCAVPSCKGYSCNGHGTCSTTGGAAACGCNPGWSGTHCETADCTDVTCSGHGTCSTSTGAAVCTCNAGWAGTDCDAPSCGSVSCFHGGTCDTGSGNATCSCATGWTGADCTTPDCTGITCSGHGSCGVGTGTAVCTCMSGWSGTDCAVADCAGITCSGHGSCGTTTGSAECTCATGWTGVDCSTPTCAGIGCSGHGSCGTTSGAAACSCNAGWSGVDCESPSCGSVTCNHGGSCSTGSGTATCTCTTGWTGTDCTTPDCTGIGCSGHGSCGTGTGSAECTCASGWSGTDCGTASCTGITCSGHGTCGTAGNVAACSCSTGWTGTDCATPTCSGVSCGAHSACTTASGSAVCACDSGYGGDLCDFTIVYGLTLENAPNWSAAASVPYDVNNSSDVGLFDRVAYRMDLDGAFVWAEVDAFTTDRAMLGVPSDWIWDLTLSDLTVRTNSPALSPVTHSTGGKMEFWSNCYGWGTSGQYDEEDDVDLSRPDCHGSMQLFDGHTTLFAMNEWTGNGATALGIGTNTQGHPDWTFMGNASSYANKRFEVYVHEVSSCGVGTCSGHGTCNASSGAAVCSCNSGWSGPTCADADCTGNSCSGHGSCATNTGVAVCTCVSGWSGMDCGTADCAGISCSGHGSCGTGGGTAACSCDSGWTGADCSTASCAGITCGGHGSCSTGSGVAACTCSSGWSGATCAIADCAGITCSGHGSCGTGSGVATCACDSGWSDATCSTADCAGVTCSGHGTCSAGSGVAVCSCSSGWSGSNCQTPDCTGITCNGHGACGTGGGSAQCTCDTGWAGGDCSACDSAHVGNDCEYALVYSLNIPTSATWTTSNDVPYNWDDSTSTVPFDRVAYRLTLNNNWVWADMRAWTTDRTKLGVPTDWIWKVPVHDVNVSTNASDPQAATHSAGNIEFYPNCYQPNGAYDWDDQVAQDDCYGSMQIFSATNTVFGFNSWVNGQTIDLGMGTAYSPDWTGQHNANSYSQRHLAVFVREVPGDCSVDPCGGHGTCNPGSVATCSCNTGYTGTYCDACAAPYADPDNDGTCTQECVSGACSSLADVRGLSTGTHTLRLRDVGDVTMYVDGTYDSGGWLLIGRGRENWSWTNDGSGNAQDIMQNLGTTSAFTPTYLSRAQIQKLIDQSPGAPDLMDVELRLHRAADSNGSAYQDSHIRFASATQWTWDFPGTAPIIDVTYDASVLGAGYTLRNVSFNDTMSPGGDDYTRIFTWPWNLHSYAAGFGYGLGVGGASSTWYSFLWENAGEGRPLPYTEVYLRLPVCAVSSCSGHGSCDDSSGVVACSCATGYGGNRCQSCATGYQDNDQNGTCELACSVSSCTGSEICDDSSGSTQCVAGSTCLSILQSNPGAPDGSYLIDPDGSGGNAPYMAQCDMTTSGGGWTVIDFQEFDNNNADGWSDQSISSGCAWGPTLGGYGLFAGYYISRSYDLHGIPHNEAFVALDYYAIDSWDGEYSYVEADGYVLWNVPYYYWTGSQLCGWGAYADRGDHIEQVVSHWWNYLNLTVGSGLDQDPGDESYAIDNVRVMVR